MVQVHHKLKRSRTWHTPCMCQRNKLRYNIIGNNFVDCYIKICFGSLMLCIGSIKQAQ